ncbi:MAG: hypothetical protein AAF612_08790 [Planctomycetota bacterium]
MSDPYELAKEPEAVDEVEAQRQREAVRAAAARAGAVRPSALAGALDDSTGGGLDGNGADTNAGASSGAGVSSGGAGRSRWCPACGYDLRGAVIDRSSGVARVACVDCGWQGLVRDTDDQPDGLLRKKVRKAAAVLAWVWVVSGAMVVAAWLIDVHPWLVHALLSTASLLAGSVCVTAVILRAKLGFGRSWLGIAGLVGMLTAVGLPGWVWIALGALVAGFLAAFEMLAIKQAASPGGGR